jgi:putative inorganic carbon (HCO3(-)) transporter
MAFRFFLTYLAAVYLRPFEYFLPALAPLRPMLLLWVLTFLSGVVAWNRTKRFGGYTLQFSLLAWFWVAIVLSLLNIRAYREIPDAIGEFSTAAMLMFLVALNVTSLARLRATCSVLLVSVALLCVQAVYAYHSGVEADIFTIRQVAVPDVGSPPVGVEAPGDDVNGYYLWRLRSVGFLQDPNDFSQIICMVLPWLWLWCRPGQGLRNLLRVGPLVALMGYCIHLTHSRGALVGLAMLGAVQFLRRAGLFWGAIIGAGLGVLGLLALQVGGRGFSSKEASANERLDAWYAGMEMFKSAPIFGVGYGHFGEHHIRTAHNSFVLCFAELGTFGYVLWLALLVLAGQCLSQIVRKGDAEQRAMGWMMWSSVAAFLSCAWFLSRTYQASLFLLLGLCFAALKATDKQDSKAPLKLPVSVEKQPFARWFRYTLLVVTLSLIGVSLFVRSAK